MDKDARIDYWTEKIETDIHELKDLEYYSLPESSIEELYKIREEIVNLIAHSELLLATIREPEPPKSFFKRLLNK